jgi:hypothetical protein
MLTVTIKLTGKTACDIELAIDEVKRLLSDGYLSGRNENDCGSYSFDVAERSLRMDYTVSGEKDK